MGHHDRGLLRKNAIPRLLAGSKERSVLLPSIRRIDDETLETMGMSVQSYMLLRKTCATYYDEYMPESSIEILGHSVGGITYRHFAS